MHLAWFIQVTTDIRVVTAEGYLKGQLLLSTVVSPTIPAMDSNAKNTCSIDSLVKYFKNTKVKTNPFQVFLKNSCMRLEGTHIYYVTANERKPCVHVSTFP